MKKLKLNITELRIDSFETTSKKNNNGTVIGHDKIITEVEECFNTDICNFTDIPQCDPTVTCPSKACSNNCNTVGCPTQVCPVTLDGCATDAHNACIPPV